MITSDVENYPGYADGVLGPTMMQDFRRQAERFGAEFLTDDVTRVDFERPFRIYVGDDEHRADAVIVATGANARQLGLETEVALQGAASRTAVCDAAFFRERNVVVVGGGDSAMEEATFLTKFATKVTLVHRRSEFRASPIMLDRAARTRGSRFSPRTSSTGPGRRDRQGDRRRSAMSTRRRTRSRRRVVRGDRPRSVHVAVPRVSRPRRGRVSRDEAASTETNVWEYLSPATSRITCTGRR